MRMMVMSSREMGMGTGVEQKEDPRGKSKELGLRLVKGDNGCYRTKYHSMDLRKVTVGTPNAQDQVYVLTTGFYSCPDDLRRPGV
jgi:hypothetical protein